MNEDNDVELAYSVLAAITAEMLDDNCTGICIPRDSSLIPNNGSLYAELQKLASSRETGVNRASP